jgi:hypothetical protein
MMTGMTLPHSNEPTAFERTNVISDSSGSPPGSDPVTPQPVWKKMISFPALMGALLVGAMFIPLRNFAVDPDVWWHIKVGATILSTHHFPTIDTYSFTASGSPWIAYEWLGEVMLGFVEHSGGLQGLMGLDLGLSIAITIALYGLATLRSKNSKGAFLACLLALPLTYVPLTLRPQMWGYLFLLLTLIVLERFREGQTRGLWFLPPMFLLWVNIHGSFVLGLFALGVYWASGLAKIHWGNLESRLWTAAERLRLELVALLILVALTLTPYGTQVCLYPLDMAFSQPINVGNIQEWQSMAFGELYGKIFLALIIGFITAQITLRPTWRLEELILVLTGIIGGCIHIRFVLAFVPFCVPMLAVILSRGFPAYEPDNDKYALNAILMVLVAGAIAWFFPSRAYLQTKMAENWPARAVAYLKLHPTPKPMFNSYGYGGYLVYQLSDVNKVFIDGRGDLYERRGVLADYLTISRLGVAAPVLLDAYGIQSCLIAHDDGLRTFLDASPGWQRVHTDPVSVLFVRRPRPAASGNSLNDAHAKAGEHGSHVPP